MRHLKKYLLDRLSNEVFLDIDDELQRFYELSITQYFKKNAPRKKNMYILETIRYHFSVENLPKKL